MQTKDLQLKRASRSILLILLLSAVGMTKICAYDFSAVCSTGQTLYYNITDEENLYVTLTFPGENGWLNSYFYGWSGYTKPTGDIILPESVQYGGLTYTVTSIGSSAFYDCSGLTANLTIPNSVTSIGYRAFSDCSGFTGVLTIPNSVTLIEYDAFRNCSGFTEVHFNATKAGPYGLITNSYSPFNGCGGTLVIGDNVERIKAYIFSFGDFTGVLTIGASVTEIGLKAFIGCSGFTAINSHAETPPTTSYTAFSGVNIDIPVVVPCGSRNAYQNADGWDQFNNILEDCTTTFSITASASPLESGIITGDGIYALGSYCTLIATANSGYDFVNWTENGTQVSDSAIYSFNVTSNRTLVANFQQQQSYAINVSANPTTGGTVMGGGNYTQSAYCTLTATANSGYSFVNWTENDSVVSTDSTCSFTVTRARTLVANFNLIPSTGNIVFADANVKALCVANWDTSEDGELSYAEAAAVTDLGIVFRSKSNIFSFNELQYFTGLTSIGNNAFFNCYNMSSVVIPNSVNTIGNDSFNGCSGLSSIAIPNTVTSIGSYAFYRCAGLVQVFIPNSIISIGNSAFSSCSELEQIIVETGNLVYDSRENCNAIIATASNTLVAGCKNSIIPNSVTSIGSSAFYGCSGLASITIPNSVTSIGSSAFRNCSSLTTVIIPNSVISIESAAFSSCSGLEQIVVETGNTAYDSRESCNAIIAIASNTLIAGCKNTIIPNSVISIGDYAFYGCSGLTSINIPNSVIAIGTYGFCRCTGLTMVDIPNSVTSIGDDAFELCNNLTSVSLPNSVTHIGINMFYLCNNLITIIIPSSVTSIGNSAFAHCTGLESMTVYAEIPPTLGNGAFNGVDKSIPVYVPNGTLNTYQSASGWNEFTNIQELGPYPIQFADANVKALCVANWDTNGDGELSYTEAASVTNLGTVFRSKSNITSFNELQFFTGLTSIGFRAFSWCYNLSSVTIPSSVNSIVNYAFYYCSDLTSIIIPSSVTSIGNNVFNYCSGLEQIVVETDNTEFDSRENCCAIINTASNTLIVGCKNTIIPNSVTSIGDYAFFGCSGLVLVNIPSSVTYIGNPVFDYCSALEQITVESGNTVYDSRGDCNAIIETASNVLIAGCKNTIIPNTVISIGSNAFSGCNGLTSITIPNSVTSIMFRGFSYCTSLTSVTIPSSVTSIGNYAFDACSNLESMIILATMPPSLLGNYSFQYVNKSIPVYVPCGSLEAYQNAEGWNAFTNIQESCSEQTITLTEGWNWFSTYIEAEDLLEQLEESLGTSGIRIQGKNGMVDRFDYQGNSYWYGSLTDLTNEQMYKVRTNAACNVVIVGSEATPADHPITITNGWNWIGFPCSQSVSLEVALSGFTPEPNDMIKGKDGAATYISNGNVSMWYGTLDTLEPGEGYMYKSNSTVPKTLIFQMSRKP